MQRVYAALAKVNPARPRWIDAPDVDADTPPGIHLHEDLLAAVGIPRGTGG